MSFLKKKKLTHIISAKKMLQNINKKLKTDLKGYRTINAKLVFRLEFMKFRFYGEKGGKLPAR